MAGFFLGNYIWRHPIFSLPCLWEEIVFFGSILLQLLFNWWLTIVETEYLGMSFDLSSLDFGFFFCWLSMLCKYTNRIMIMIILINKYIYIYLRTHIKRVPVFISVGEVKQTCTQLLGLKWYFHI